MPFSLIYCHPLIVMYYFFYHWTLSSYFKLYFKIPPSTRAIFMWLWKKMTVNFALVKNKKKIVALCKTSGKILSLVSLLDVNGHPHKFCITYYEQRENHAAQCHQQSFSRQFQPWCPRFHIIYTQFTWAKIKQTTQKRFRMDPSVSSFTQKN